MPTGLCSLCCTCCRIQGMVVSTCELHSELSLFLHRHHACNFVSSTSYNLHCHCSGVNLVHNTIVASALCAVLATCFGYIYILHGLSWQGSSHPVLDEGFARNVPKDHLQRESGALRRAQSSDSSVSSRHASMSGLQAGRSTSFRLAPL